MPLITELQSAVLFSVGIGVAISIILPLIYYLMFGNKK